MTNALAEVLPLESLKTLPFLRSALGINLRTPTRFPVPSLTDLPARKTIASVHVLCYPDRGYGHRHVVTSNRVTHPTVATARVVVRA